MLVIGIGNPGVEYEGTRHNVGFDVVDELARRRKAEWEPFHPGGPGHALCVTTRYAGKPLVLAKPLRYVNVSGPVVQALLSTHGLDVAECLVVLDDVQLELGRLRIRGKGSDGGHNGMASIIETLGTDRVARLRIGVGAPGRQGALVSHVLGPFDPDEQAVIDAARPVAADCAEWWVRSGLQVAMNRFNAPASTDGEDDSNNDSRETKGATP
jgi:PTH1 family peptidyl-tRNA hydrolase